MSKKVSIAFHMRHEDFLTQPGVKAANILRDIADTFEKMNAGDVEKNAIYDTNGNKIGEACFCFEQDEN